MDLYFWRDSTGTEIDVLIDQGNALHPLETKSGSTWASDWLDGVRKWQGHAKASGSELRMPQVIYGGETS